MCYILYFWNKILFILHGVHCYHDFCQQSQNFLKKWIRDPCNWPRWVLDSPFPVGTYQSFQILDFFYNGGTHQNCLLDWSTYTKIYIATSIPDGLNITAYIHVYKFLKSSKHIITYIIVPCMQSLNSTVL